MDKSEQRNIAHMLLCIRDRTPDPLDARVLGDAADFIRQCAEQRPAFRFECNEDDMEFIQLAPCESGALLYAAPQPASGEQPEPKAFDNAEDLIAHLQSLPPLAPTHFCPGCKALWRQCDDDSWNLRSAECCHLCDMGAMTHLVRLDQVPQPEPSETGPWEVNEWSASKVVLQSDDFTHDVALIVNGDFPDHATKRAYAQMMCERLNAQPEPSAAQIEAAAYERAAQACEKRASEYEAVAEDINLTDEGRDSYESMRAAAESCAKAIRALKGEQK